MARQLLAQQAELAARSAKPVAALPTGVAGVFAAKLPAKMVYRLRWQGFGHQWEVQDPFRFPPVLGELDEYLLAEGKHSRLWHVLGAQVMTHQGAVGTNFAVWAPNAVRVSVVVMSIDHHLTGNPRDPSPRTEIVMIRTIIDSDGSCPNHPNSNFTVDPLPHAIPPYPLPYQAASFPTHKLVSCKPSWQDKLLGLQRCSVSTKLLCLMMGWAAS